MLGRTTAQWEASSAIFTASEIAQQPETWRKTLQQMHELREPLGAFLQGVLSQDDCDIILTGAGTSEFVGNAVVSDLRDRYGFHIRSHGTTDIVASPRKYLSATRPTLLISFARSGNSPESVGAVQAADCICENVRHLFITCNKDGALAKTAAGREDCFSIELSDETNDKGFAMTSSFSNMYLAVFCALRLTELDSLENSISLVCAAGHRCLESSAFFEKVVKEYDYDRLVFLGSAELKGIAQESALKSLELTAGRVTPMFDTPMGFRHGPKSIVNDRTLTVIYLSDDPSTRRYEMDLLREMSGQRKGNRILALTNKPDAGVKALCDHTFAVEAGEELPSALLGLVYVLAAQLLALYKSQALCITTDNPCPTGEVNRVVKGVTIYPVIS